MLAKKSIYFEQKILKEVVGSQDQIAAAYGGFNKIVFKVPDKTNKKILKKTIEKIFKINVTKINIINKKPRKKFSRNRKIKISGYKKAIVTLKKGQCIDLTTGI